MHENYRQIHDVTSAGQQFHPYHRCSEANVWSSRFDALESLRHEVECTGITASCGRTRSNARESLRHAVEYTGITAPRCRADCSRLVHICAPKAGWCTEVSQFSAFCEAEVVIFHPILGDPSPINRGVEGLLPKGKTATLHTI